MVLVVVSRLLGIYYIIKSLLLDLTASKKFDYIFLNDHVIYPMLRKNKVRQQGLHVTKIQIHRYEILCLNFISICAKVLNKRDDVSSSSASTPYAVQIKLEDESSVRSE